MCRKTRSQQLKPFVRKKVAREMGKVGLLENNVIVPFTSLSDETIHKGTLNATESRQYRERGLLHVTDGAYTFFMKLEQERVDKINVGKLTSTESEMVEVSIKEVCSNQSLKDAFLKLFDVNDVGDEVR